ncbi:EAL domain-containing protein [Hydrogenivirga caldilitoris]|uniref:EAL domain-containing protein n=1 Tax=Hydrogenivirga caldilitoris TaxID=246264 RepID=UPI001FE904BC|nr:EAL domain-containing protein [Hydrogenivirga caldilitoris]
MIERIAKLLKLSEEEIKRRLSYVSLSEEDIGLLRELSGKVSEEKIAELFGEFYRHLLSFEEMRKILEREEGLIERLKKAQAKYFRELLEGEYSLDYALSRLKVGQVHEKAGVEPKYYTGAFAKWVESVLPVIEEKTEKDKLLSTLLALFKVVILDLTLSLDAYLFSKIIKVEAERYRVILNSVRDAIIVVDLETRRIADLNASALELLGLENEREAIGRDALWVHPEEVRHTVGEKFSRYIEKGAGITEVEYVENKRTGEWIPVEIGYGTFEHEERTYVVGVFRDIRERLRREEAIRRLNRLYETLSRINFITTTAGSEEELFSSAVSIIREGGFRYVGIFRKGEDKAIAEEGTFLESDTSACVPMEENGLYLLISRWFEEDFTKEEIELLREVAHDISFSLRNLRTKEKLKALEVYDPLTGLLNRTSLLSKLPTVLERAKRDKKEVAFLLLDIDNFSELNEAFGHKKVDRLLKEIATRLKKEIRGSDLIGRVGADEFGIILLAEDAGEAAEKLLRRIRNRLRKPFKINSNELFITLSAGVSSFPEEIEELYSKALSALQRAKEFGGNRTVYYSETAEREVFEKVKLRTELRRALEREEFLLYYQPKVELRTEKVVGAEALLRWNRGGEIVPPIKFIPLLEESELIHEVGEWVVREACRQAQEWRSKGIELSIAVNVSPLQMKVPLFAESFMMLIFGCGEGSGSIEVEITESAVMEDVERMIEILKILTVRGIRTYIDDFGTGYSSLAYLKKLPVYALKIDREFVKGIPQDEDNLEIVKATVNIAKSFGLKTVAEGVETREQAEILKELGCDYAQGYYFGKPVPPEEFESYIR